MRRTSQNEPRNVPYDPQKTCKGRVNMQAYEFYAKPKDGIIPIPEQYRGQITDLLWLS